jgi:hypothetical protein
VRDAAIECLEEVYRVLGEQLVDLLSTHNLRAAHLNAIYARLAQLGADVVAAPVASHASAGAAHGAHGGSPYAAASHASAHHGGAGDDYDTASSGARGGMYASNSSSSGRASTAAPQRVLAAADADLATVEESALDAGQSWGSNLTATAAAAPAAAAAAPKAKRGGYKVRCGACARARPHRDAPCNKHTATDGLHLYAVPGTCRMAAASPRMAGCRRCSR